MDDGGDSTIISILTKNTRSKTSRFVCMTYKCRGPPKHRGYTTEPQSLLVFLGVVDVIVGGSVGVVVITAITRVVSGQVRGYYDGYYDGHVPGGVSWFCRCG
jgi:hypothetical protein